MLIPENLQHFPHPALIIVSDSVMAKFFVAHEDNLEELDSLTLPRENPQDKEGSVRIDGSSQVSGANTDIDDTPRLKQFIHKVVERTNELVADNGIAHLHLVMPAEIEHDLTKQLPPPLKEKVVKRIHKDLVKHAPLEIVERLFEV